MHRTGIRTDDQAKRGTDIRILAIPGSLRQQSYNKSLLIEAAGLAPPGTSVWVYEALGEIPFFNEDVANAATPSGVVRLREAVSCADGLLIATPEYNQAVPGVVKNMIDWLSLGESHEGLEGRPVAVTGVTTGPWGTRLAQTMLRQMLVATQAALLPQPSLFLRRAENLFDKDGNLADDTTRRRLSDLVTAFSTWIRFMKSQSDESPQDDNNARGEGQVAS